MADVQEMREIYRKVQGIWPSVVMYNWLMMEIFSSNQKLQELGTESQFDWEQLRCNLIIIAQWGAFCCNLELRKYQKFGSSHLVTDYKHDLSL